VLRREISFNILIWGMFGAGFVNVIYCGWVIAFGDFIPWNNPYGNILGTFGNPNFIGAFLGFLPQHGRIYLKSRHIINIRVAVQGCIFLLRCMKLSIQMRFRASGRRGRSWDCWFYLVRSKFEGVIAQVGYVVAYIRWSLLPCLERYRLAHSPSTFTRLLFHFVASIGRLAGIWVASTHLLVLALIHMEIGIAGCA
jgi:hypothetical protein